jgi:exodeoxyribonuclease VII small subunit
VTVKPPSDHSPGSGEWTFEQALANLESVIRDLEDGRLGLNESLNRYEDGVRILRYCHQALNDAERKILLLTAVDESGEAIAQPFDDRELSLEEKRDQRVRRRSRAGIADGCNGGDGPAPSRSAYPSAEEANDVDRQKGLF